MYRDEPPYRRPFRPGKVLFFLLAAAAFVLIVGGVVMWLWNAILPDLTGVRAIKLWEAVGLLVLSRILFGGLNMGRYRRFGKKRAAWRQKWMNMSDEERAEFKARWRERCGRKGRR